VYSSVLLSFACASGAQASGGVVSFAPSNTELLFALGAEDKIQGVCSYCDFPVDAKNKTKVGTFVSANLERLARIHPDTVLLVNGQEALANVLKRNGFHVVMLSNNSLADIDRNVRTLGALTGHESDSQKLCQAFDQSMKSLKKILQGTSRRPKVFYCTWPNPLLTVGRTSFLNDVITTCSGTNIAGDLSAPYPHFSTERLVLSDPDLIILPYEARGLKFLEGHPWSCLRAVREHRVYYLPEPAKDGLARPTTRIVEGMYWLAEKLHPELSLPLKDWFTHCTEVISPRLQPADLKRHVR
jgi:iron complex transport system substrate-binding protein